MHFETSEPSDDAGRAFDKLADYLARRDHSVKELKEKLARLFTEDAIESALEEAQKRNYLAPPREISERAAQELHQKNKGFLYIQNYLQGKGLPEIEKDHDQEVEKAQSSLASKIAQYPHLSFEVRAKLERHLNNRGFDFETIETVIKQLRFSNPEEEQ